MSHLAFRIRETETSLYFILWLVCLQRLIAVYYCTFAQACQEFYKCHGNLSSEFMEEQVETLLIFRWYIELITERTVLHTQI